MRKYSAPFAGVAGLLCACFLLVPSSLPCTNGEARCSQQRAISESKVERTGNAEMHASELDEIYFRTLVILEESEAAWRKRPGDPVALRSHLKEVRVQLVALRDYSDKEQGKSGTSQLPTKSGAATKIPAPSGPVQPSQEPSTEEEVKRRAKATHGKFLTGPIEDSEKPTLAGVPPSWIIDSCGLALERLDKLEASLRETAIDRDAVANSLVQLRRIILGMSSPPPPTPPVTPKGRGVLR